MAQEPQYLYRRPKGIGIYWFRRRISGSRQVHRESLKTRDRKEAVRARDHILKGWDEIDRKVSDAQNLIAIRRQYVSATKPEEKAQLEELIQDKAEDMAQSLGVLENKCAGQLTCSVLSARYVNDLKNLTAVSVC